MKLRVNLARLNHILIPAMKEDRDRLRGRFWVRVLGPVFLFHGMLSREGRALALITVLVGAAGIDVLETEVHLFFAMLVGLLFASLLLRWFYRTNGLVAEVTALPRIVAGEPQLFSIALENRNPTPALDLAIEGPFLPWDGKWLADAPHVVEVPGNGRVTVNVRARFSARGEHHLDSFSVASLVPLGLAQGPKIATGECRFLVVPKPANVTRLTLTEPGRAGQRTASASRRAGDDELVSVRPYRNGDPLKLLHARTWARTNIPHIRQYAREQSEQVALVCLFDDRDEFLVEATISLAAGIAAFLANRGGGLDYLILGSRRHRIEPRQGRGANDLALGLLAKWKSEPAVTEEALLDAIPRTARVVVVTQRSSEPSLVEQLGQRGTGVRVVAVVDDEVASPEVAAVRFSSIAKSEVIVL